MGLNEPEIQYWPIPIYWGTHEKVVSYCIGGPLGIYLLPIYCSYCYWLVLIPALNDVRRGANVLPPATGGLSMQPVQPVRGGFMPRGPIRPPPAAPQAQARALSAPAKQPQRSPGIPPTTSGPELREAHPMERSRGRARSARPIRVAMEDMLFHMAAVMVVVTVHASF